MSEAKKLELELQAWDKTSEEQLNQHHRWAQATTALQISIAMAVIALLTRSSRLENGLFVLSGLGVVLGMLARFHI
jgi:hypothetical protein